MSHFIITSDIHLTDRPEDEYRWKLFHFLEDLAEEVEGDVTAYILGDLANSKDRHPGRLINRLVSSLISLSCYVNKIVILKGNHDYDQEEGDPFWSFLGAMPQIKYVSEPVLLDDDPPVFCIPHSRTPMQQRQDINWIDASYASAIFMHETFGGCKVESGHVMTSSTTLPDPVAFTKVPILSGDIHVPQKIKVRGAAVEYVGAPYHIRFGDQFTPRVIVGYWKGGKAVMSGVFPNLPRRLALVVTNPEKIRSAGLLPGDQVKVTVRSSPTHSKPWSEVSRRVEGVCGELGVELVRLQREVVRRVPLLQDDTGVEVLRHTTPQEALVDFCKRKGIPEAVRDIGDGLIGQQPT